MTRKRQERQLPLVVFAENPTFVMISARSAILTARHVVPAHLAEAFAKPRPKGDATAHDEAVRQVAEHFVVSIMTDSDLIMKPPKFH